MLLAMLYYIPINIGINASRPTSRPDPTDLEQSKLIFIVIVSVQARPLAL